MSPHDKIYEMLSLASSNDRAFPATVFYNEGWLLRVILDWFSRHTVSKHPLDFMPGARWFSEGLLPSAFLARPGQRPDVLAEGWTHADGVVGHLAIGSGAMANVSLTKGALQFVVTEAKMFSPLSQGGTHARDFDQAARNVACIAQVLSVANRPPRELQSLGFFVIAPVEQIDKKRLFDRQLAKSSIGEKVSRRVAQYASSPDHDRKVQWFHQWFEPTLEGIRIETIPWEEIVRFIEANDARFGPELSAFYNQCCKFNRVQEPEAVTSIQETV